MNDLPLSHKSRDNIFKSPLVQVQQHQERDENITNKKIMRILQE